MSCSNSAKDSSKKDANESEDEESNEPPIIEMPARKVVNEGMASSTGEETNQKRPDPSIDRSENSVVNSTDRNIQLIKERLLMIRLEKARVEEKKRVLLMMHNEAARLRDIHRLKNAVNLSIQQAEARIIAASRAIRKNRPDNDIVRDQFAMNHSPLSLQQLHSQLKLLQRTVPNSTSGSTEQHTSRAFAA
jgi:hypothetical protein